jgi:uncharacterized protein involved in exopolysaccharide biosynthesis
MSAARVKTTPPDHADLATFIPAQRAILSSSNVLDQVIEKLNLNETWGKKYNNGMKLHILESQVFLMRQLDFRQLHHTSTLEIRCYSDDKYEAASIANAVADAYRGLPLPAEKVVRPEIIERAVPNPKPVRPNKPFNIALGGIIGLLAGSVAGLIVLRLVSWHARKKVTPSPIPSNLAAR